MRRDDVIFMDIDTQFDFMHLWGKLSVPNVIEIIPNIKLLIDFASKSGITIISTVDAHNSGDLEFRDFPPHCIKNSDGAVKIDETLTYNDVMITDTMDLATLNLDRNKKQIIVQKNTINVFENKNIKRIVEFFSKNSFVVFGVTTEYCVKYAVTGLCHRAYAVYLITDAIKPVTNKTGDTAIDEMKKAGAQMIRTKQILKDLAI